MKKMAGLIPATILIVCLLWLSLAAAWTISGNVYIDDSIGAPCLTVDFYDNVDPDCEGTWLGSTETVDEGYYEFLVPGPHDTVWVQACFDTTSTCQWCTDWVDCVPDTMCRRATTDDNPPAVDFDFEQPDCYCP
jgi:hypothetical protein